MWEAAGRVIALALASWHRPGRPVTLTARGATPASEPPRAQGEWHPRQAAPQTPTEPRHLQKEMCPCTGRPVCLSNERGAGETDNRTSVNCSRTSIQWSVTWATHAAQKLLQGPRRSSGRLQKGAAVGSMGASASRGMRPGEIGALRCINPLVVCTLPAGDGKRKCLARAQKLGTRDWQASFTAPTSPSSRRPSGTLLRGQSSFRCRPCSIPSLQHHDAVCHAIWI